VAKKKDKKDLAIIALMVRLTDFEIQTSDMTYLSWLEGLRELILNYQDECNIRTITSDEVKETLEFNMVDEFDVESIIEKLFDNH